MVLWVGGVLLVGFGLMIGVNRLLAALNVHRAAPDEAPGGFGDVLARLRESTERRQARRDARH